MNKYKLPLIVFACAPALLTACVDSDTNYGMSSTSYYGQAQMVPVSDQLAPKRNYSFPVQRPATGQKEFVFNPNTLMWGAYDASGNLVNQGAASGGRDFCPDIGRGCKTPSGTYRISSKGGPECVSKLYPVGVGGSPMPYCMYFAAGYAVHGSYEVPNYNASHGCVRVHPSDAQWLSENFMDIGTQVVVLPY